MEVLVSIRKSLDQLTEGCEVTRSEDGFFCVKHGGPMDEGDTRCDAFVRRRSNSGGEDFTQKQIEAYVRGVLGIKEGKNFRKLVDWWAERGSQSMMARTP